jgi:hypothetical protein
VNVYHYDQVYPYEKALAEVKELTIPTILPSINKNDLISIGLTGEAYADIVYTHIIALGYNEGDLKAAFDDLFPTRNSLFYPETDESEAAAKMFLNLSIIAEDYKHQVWAFQDFHKNTQALKPYKEVIVEVKKQLLAAELGF